MTDDGAPITRDRPYPNETASRAVSRFERRVLGSPLRLTLASTELLDRSATESAWGAVSDEFDQVDAAMSRFRADSGVTSLNERAGSGVITVVAPRLYHAIAASERARMITGGRFDACVLVALDRLGHRGAPIRASVPPPSERSRETWVERWPRQTAVRLAQPIDLGGIGKGLALRWAARRLSTLIPERSQAGFVLDAGGDLVASGPSPEGGPWSLGIEDPSGTDDPVAVVALTAGALCTSSIRLGRWRGPDGRGVHHLIDPATGEPGTGGLASVTVAGSDPAWSEVWSKSLFLAGARAIATEARSRGMAAWWIDERGRLSMTPAARASTTWP